VFYRITQEAMHNVVKHAHASTIAIRLTTENRTVTMEVRDDGVSFDAGQSFPGHLGLVSFKELVDAIGATIDIGSALGAGTHVHLTLESG
jgi:signal transduction histidine kinase